MENFRWASDDGTLPPPTEVTRRFRLSDEQAPRLSEVRSAEQVPLPIIDMAAADDEELADEVARASEEFGFFIVTNHGFPEEVWRRAAESVRDFFLLPPEIKAMLAGEGAAIDAVNVYNCNFLNDWEDQRQVYLWSEVVNHVWHPTNDFTAGFSHQIPPTYRENAVAYAKEMGVLMTRLLSLLSKGLGLQHDYLQMRLGDHPLYKFHGTYYPPCPEPDHAIGLPIHSDSLALSVVRTLDEIPGLQILKGEDWVEVTQLPNSFVINIGDQLQVLSNGRYKSVLHRVVTNRSHTRVSLAHFWGPSLNETIGPIDDLVDEQHPRVYRSYVYKEFVEKHDKLHGKRRKVKELFLMNPPAT